MGGLQRAGPTSHYWRRPEANYAPVKNASLALVLVLIGIGHGVAWKLVPSMYEASAWNVTGAVFRVLLLVLIGSAYRSLAMWLAVALLAGFELQTASCSIWYAVTPWPMSPGDELCSSKLHFPVGTVSLWLALLIVGILRNEENAKPIN